MASRLKRMFSLRNGRTEQPPSPIDAVVAQANGTETDPESPHTNGVTVPKALPSFDELPKFKNFNGCAWDVWGKDDELGTVNMLTEEVVQKAAREEIRSGRSVSLNWPIHFPSRPTFGRKIPSITTYTLYPDFPSIPARDDVIHINTQSGTQWDGLKHAGLLEYNVFYNNTPAESLSEGEMEIHDPSEIDHTRVKLGIHNWSNHGICGRGVFLDLVDYYTGEGGELPYDPWATHPISVAELEACAKKQGVTFRQADILLIRMGFIQKYYSVGNDTKAALRDETERFAGIEQSEDMKRFLWNNHFAAIASDQPTLERWPSPQGVPHLHQTILALWGMPLGEMFDLETLSQVCKETKRYTFFFSSWPLNIIGGAASPPNAAAYF